MAGWSEVKAKALKVLGDEAKVPDLPDVAEKAIKDMIKKNTEFEKSRDDIKAKLLAVENGNAAVRNALKQFEAKIEKEDFKLDSKNKDDAKKIQQAQKVLCEVLDTAIKACNDDNDMLDELDKHVVQLGKYEQPPTTI